MDNPITKQNKHLKKQNLNNMSYKVKPFEEIQMEIRKDIQKDFFLKSSSHNEQTAYTLGRMEAEYKKLYVQYKRLEETIKELNH